MDMISHGWSDQFVPGIAAMVDDVRVRGEDSFDSQLSLMNCQDIFDRVEFGRDFGGNDTSVMLGGTGASSRRAIQLDREREWACAPGATAAAISSRCKAIASVLQDR